MWIVALALLCALFLTHASRLEATTVYVKADSTGDVATIALAMQVVGVGDTVLVAPGVYRLSSAIRVTNGVLLISEVPGGAKLVPVPEDRPVGAMSLGPITAYTEITGFWFEGFVYPGAGVGGGIGLNNCSEVYIRRNIFTNNYQGIYMDWDWVHINENTFVGNEWGIYVNAGSGVTQRNILWDRVVLGQMNVGCNDLFDIGDIEEGWHAINFSADPMFCGADDLRIQSDSPCAPGNSPVAGCNTFNELIGALPADCSVTPVRATTWGQLKALLRGTQERQR